MPLDQAILSELADVILHPVTSATQKNTWLAAHSIAGSERPKTGYESSYIAADLISVQKDRGTFGADSGYASIVQITIKNMPDFLWLKAAVDLVDNATQVDEYYEGTINSFTQASADLEIAVNQAAAEGEVIVLYEIWTDVFPV